MALKEKLVLYHNKCRDGQYDHITRSIAIFVAVPAIVLYAIDLHRYKKYSALHHVQHHRSLTIDAVGLAFAGLTLLWNLASLAVRRSMPVTPLHLAVMDFMLSVAATVLTDMTFSMRTANGTCIRALGECSPSAQSIMQAAGGMMILLSIPHHTIWCSACTRYFRRWRQKKKNAASTDPAVVDVEALSFSNDFLPRYSETSPDPVAVEQEPEPESEALSFSNEIK